MAKFDDAKGHWVTVNNRHLFISDDPAEKQEREIAESKKRADEYNKSREDEKSNDPLETNSLYKGLKMRADKALKMPESNIDEIRKKEGELYQLLGAIKGDAANGDTYKKIEDEQRRLELAINDYIEKTHGGKKKG